MAKILKAKSITVPDNIWEQFDRFHSHDGSDLTDIIADMGEIRNKDRWGLAVGMIKPFKGLVDAHREVTGDKFGISGFSDIMSGLMLSYVLGWGEWNEKLIAYIPEVPSFDELDSYDFIRLRNGNKVKPEVLAHLIFTLTSEECLAGIFKKVTKKTILGNFKSIPASELTMVLLATMRIADEITGEV
jgi:hypothetical protein